MQFSVVEMYFYRTKLEAVRSYDTMVNLYISTRRHILEDCRLRMGTILFHPPLKLGQTSTARQIRS
jgi:hypothetical protein